MNHLPVNPLQKKSDTVYLTPCEFEIIDDIIMGVSISRLCVKYFRSKNAIKFRLTGIYKKFGVTCREELIELAATKGIQYTFDGVEIHCVFTQLKKTHHWTQA